MTTKQEMDLVLCVGIDRSKETPAERRARLLACIEIGKRTRAAQPAETAAQAADAARINRAEARC